MPKPECERPAEGDSVVSEPVGEMGWRGSDQGSVHQSEDDAVEPVCEPADQRVLDAVQRPDDWDAPGEDLHRDAHDDGSDERHADSHAQAAWRESRTSSGVAFTTPSSAETRSSVSVTVVPSSVTVAAVRPP